MAERAAIDAEDQVCGGRPAPAWRGRWGRSPRRCGRGYTAWPRAPWRAARPSERRRGAAVDIIIGKDGDAFAGVHAARNRAPPFPCRAGTRGSGSRSRSVGARKAGASSGGARRARPGCGKAAAAGGFPAPWPRPGGPAWDRGRPSGARSARTRRKERRSACDMGQGVPETGTGRKGGGPGGSAQRVAIDHPPDRAGLGPHQDGFGRDPARLALDPGQIEPLVTPVAAKITSAVTRSSRV
jgi:hypothetical protein